MMKTFYEFRSAKGTTVTVSSGLGEDSARQAAMKQLWGPAKPPVFMNRGEGLHLVKISREAPNTR
jgi:hypothetical protein